MQCRRGARKGHEGCTTPRSTKCCNTLHSFFYRLRSNMGEDGETVEPTMCSKEQDEMTAGLFESRWSTWPRHQLQYDDVVAKWACTACWETASAQRASRMLERSALLWSLRALAPSPARHGMGQSKQSPLLGHGTMGVVFCVWCAHQGSEAQSALLQAQAPGGRAGLERQATGGYLRREALAHRRSGGMEAESVDPGCCCQV